jgi:hypothetical protein
LFVLYFLRLIEVPTPDRGWGVNQSTPDT